MQKEKLILIVDDNPDDLALTLRALRRNGLMCQVVVTQTGEEALEWLFGTGKYADRDCSLMPFLILLDLHMPGISGFEVLKEIRKQETTQFSPVVVFSTSEEPEDIEKSYDFGANSYVHKPTDFTGYSESMYQLSAYWFDLNEEVRASV